MGFKCLRHSNECKKLNKQFGMLRPLSHTTIRHSIFNFDGLFTVHGHPIIKPYNKKPNDLRNRRERICDNIWLSYNPQKVPFLCIWWDNFKLTPQILIFGYKKIQV